MRYNIRSRKINTLTHILGHKMKSTKYLYQLLKVYLEKLHAFNLNICYIGYASDQSLHAPRKL